MKMKKQVSIGLLSILIASGLDPLVGICQTSGIKESSRVLNEAVQKNSGEEELPEGTSITADSTTHSQAEDTNTTTPKVDVSPESSEESALSQKKLSSQAGEKSSEIKEDIVRPTTSEAVINGETDDQTVQAKAIENIDDWMPDKNLQTAIASILNMNVSQITKNDMLKVRGVSANNINNLTGIEYATNMSRFVLFQGSISDLSPLQNLTKLTNINLNYNKISDISPLQNLPQLTNLDISGNQISDISSLQNFPHLIRLNISSNQISDVSLFQNLTQLTNLNLSYNKISDISSLQNLTNLTSLDISNNQISDISSLTNLTASIYAQDQTLVSPVVYISNKKPYSISIKNPIMGVNSKETLFPQNNNYWTGIYNSGKVEWTGGDQVSQTGNLIASWNSNDGRVNFSGMYEQPYILSKTTVDAHDSILYIGESWNAEDNFDGAKDKDGNPVNFQDVQVTGTVDTTQPGKYKVTYSYGGVQKEIEVTVLQNQTSVEAHNSTLYTGDSWNAENNFDGAKDKDGNPVNFQDVQVTGTVDTTQPGKYKVTYSYGGVQKEIEVTVLQNQISVEAHNSTLYTGDSWNAEDNFDGAKDKDGNPVNFQDVQVTGTVDTTQPGKYKVTYSYGGVQKDVEVTVFQKVVPSGNDNIVNGDNKEQNPRSTSSSRTSNVSQCLISSESERNSLPLTGEKSSVWLLISGVMLFIFASAIALLSLKKSK